MIVVRYPNGTAITYPEATQICYKENTINLYRDKDQKYIVAIIQHSAGVIIDMSRYRDYETPAQRQHLQDAAERVLAEVEDVPASKLAKLKAQLHRFNAKTGRWRKQEIV